MPEAALKHGDEVEVRSAVEILATLDDSGSLARLPFMPEMIQYCGQRFVVDATAERLCDTLKSSGCRRIPETVLVRDLRCDGSGHDRCQADCRLLWKHAWLRRVEPGTPPEPRPEGEEAARTALLALTARATKQANGTGEQPGELYRCQATELLRASGPTSRFPYLAELTSGNVAPGRYARVVARAAVWESLRKLKLLPHISLPPTRSPPLRRPPLDLQPGEWVRIRSREEIAETLDSKGGTRGLWFDREMLEFCGRSFRVKERVAQFVCEDGRMVKLKSAAVKLEGVMCSGAYSVGRWFCPRAIYSFWREDWLERISSP